MFRPAVLSGGRRPGDAVSLCVTCSVCPCQRMDSADIRTSTTLVPSSVVLLTERMCVDSWKFSAEAVRRLVSMFVMDGSLFFLPKKVFTNACESVFLFRNPSQR